MALTVARVFEVVGLGAVALAEPFLREGDWAAVTAFLLAALFVPFLAGPTFFFEAAGVAVFAALLGALAFGCAVDFFTAVELGFAELRAGLAFDAVGLDGATALDLGAVLAAFATGLGAVLPTFFFGAAEGAALVFAEGFTLALRAGLAAADFFTLGAAFAEAVFLGVDFLGAALGAAFFLELAMRNRR
ncbi:hypothetical protein [Cephaloticoccus primus]|uniref:hypothetical protein n=1 Tax=Cephaloticoccus primus TaxID=1548207 RepID=UPI001E4769F8|nr:hypothetical protein [Cephaloticoccus primus]